MITVPPRYLKSVTAAIAFPAWLLPDRQLGPLDAWNPAQLWWIIILVTGFSFAGYIANRLFGARHGTAATAIIGGIYSSTALTQALAQRLGTAERPGAETAGIALASATMYLHVLLLVAVLAGRLLLPFALIVAPAFLVATVAGAWLYRQAPASDGRRLRAIRLRCFPPWGSWFRSPSRRSWSAERWAASGNQGIAVLLFLMGAFDVDASIVTAGGLPETAIGMHPAALAIAGTIIANMLVKIAVTLSRARRKGLRAAAALAVSCIGFQ